jgi:serine/threonine protein kinase
MKRFSSSPPGALNRNMAESGQASSPTSTAPPDPLIGRVINARFKITGVIARGGMGKVYRAEQAPLGRVCALKVLTTSYQGEHDPEFNKRFFLEASIASKITHPNSVTIFDYGQTDDDIYYMAMEYLEGVTLHRAIRIDGTFPEQRVAHIGRQICRALREAHALGCIHRDLKPANIFLVAHGDEPDFVKVLDFGLVKNILGETKPEDQLTQTGLFMGSPKYMAPEQIRGEPVDARTDIYALGIIMYEMLTGKVPFERATSLSTLMAQVNDIVPSLREMNPNVIVSAELEDLIVRCVAKNPDDRAYSMDEVLRTLKRVSGQGATMTGEFSAQSAAASGSFVRAPSSVAPNSVVALPVPATANVLETLVGDGSVSVSMTGNTHPPSVTPMLGSSGGAASLAPPDFRRRTGSGKIVGALVGGAALAVVLGSFILRKPTPDAPPTIAVAPLAPPPVSPPAPPTPAPWKPAPAPVATTMSVHFVSDPPGASVKENGAELCAATPCDHDFPADANLEHKLVVARAGYRPESRTVRATDAQVAVTLSRLAAAKWTPPPPSTPKAPETAPATPQGFKEIPY